MNAHSSRYPAVAVVGHLVKDEILTLGGEEHISLGGIAYNLAALAAIQKTGTIHPVCRIGNDIDDLASALFGLSPLIDPSNVSRIGRPNVVNRLVYCPDGSREEWNSGKHAPLRLNPALHDCDAILLNFISGSDIRLGDLLSFRKRFSRLIYCDFHSLSLGYGTDHHRFHRYHPRWRDYLSAADIVQMNIFELSTIARRALPDTESVFESCALLHGAGPKIAVITTGRDGMMLSISPQGYFYHVPAISVGNEVDATGCGDTVSAAFLYSYLKSNDAIEALEMANWHAAAKATFSGISGFKEIDSVLSKIGPPAKAIRVMP
jgi:hypothetical protein